MLATCVRSKPVGVVQLFDTGIGFVQYMIEMLPTVAPLVPIVNVKVCLAF